MHACMLQYFVYALPFSLITYLGCLDDEVGLTFQYIVEFLSDHRTYKLRGEEVSWKCMYCCCKDEF